MKAKALGLALSLVVGLSATSASAGSILFVDVGGSGTQTSTWLSNLSALGHSTTVLNVGHGGNLSATLSGYDTVIVSNGDNAYSNLSATTVSNLIGYLNGGGSVLVAGGHSLYDEPNAGVLASTYLGVNNYQYNMPMFTGSSATASGAAGSYTLAPWPNGIWDDMLTGFAVNVGTTLALQMNTGWMNQTLGATAIAAVHTTSTYGAAVWGFDLNYITSFAQQQQLLSYTLNAIAPQSGVPAPGALALLGFGFAALGAFRRRKPA